MDDLLKFHYEELNKISTVYCLKTKDVAEHILQDKRIQQAATPTIQKFKEEVQKFLQMFATYSHEPWHYYQMAMFFNDIQLATTNKADLVYISDLLQKLGHSSIFEQFTANYVHLAKDEFIPKFKKYWQQLSRQEQERQYFLMSWFKVLQDCKGFLCFNRYLPLFPRVVKGAFDRKPRISI